MELRAGSRSRCLCTITEQKTMCNSGAEGSMGQEMKMSSGSSEERMGLEG